MMCCVGNVKKDAKIELGKQYRTRDGREVRIYAVDGGGGRMVHGAVLNENGWHSVSWERTGKLSVEDTHIDLVEVKPRVKTKAWLNVYRHEDGFEFTEVWESKHAADSARGDACIACVEIDIDVEEGHGL